MRKIGIVIPAYNESENLKNLSLDILKYTPDAQILIVDDSPDLKSVQIIQEMKHPQVNISKRNTKGGRGSAVIAGLNEMMTKDFEYIIEMDADFSHPPSQIPELIDYVTNNKIDLLIASRYLPKSSILNWPISRRLFSKCANLLAKFLLRVPVSDYTNGYRVYSNKAANNIVETCGKLGTGFIALSEILVNVHYRGFKVSEVATVFTNRIRGESSLSMKEIWNALVGLNKIYKLKRELST